MRSIAFLCFVLLAVFGSISTASAQATRTWVSGVGDDANPCSRTAPCKTFAGAISKTAAGGEISVLDPGGYGSVTITKSISLVAIGMEGSILASGTNGITINAGVNDIVFVKGLIIDGGTTGLNGIRILQAGRVYVTDTVIRNFRSVAGSGVLVQPTASPVSVYLNNVEILHNVFGLVVAGSTIQAAAFVNSSVLEGNNNNSMIVNGATAKVTALNSQFTGSNVGLISGGLFESFGNNVVTGANPTSTVTLK